MEASRAPEQLTYPGSEAELRQQPRDEMADYEGRGLLAGQVALVTGGDSGIGRAVAIAFAKEGADVAIAYLSELEDADAEKTIGLVEAAGGRGLAIRCDLSVEEECRRVVAETVAGLGGLHVLVNNVAWHVPADRLTDISTEQWQRALATNLSSYFWCTRFALAHLPDGGAIVNTGSVNGLRGNKSLMDYSATKGGVHAFSQALAQSLIERRIRVNVVAPGPVWTPLIASTMPKEKIETFGQETPMGRAAQPDEIAPSYVFFAASRLSSFYTGEILAPVGGETMPG